MYLNEWVVAYLNAGEPPFFRVKFTENRVGECE